MVWVIYPLINTRNGRKRSEFAVATVYQDEENKVVLDCPDREIAKVLKRHFNTVLDVRESCGTTASVLTYQWKEVFPGCQQHFTEALARLHTLGYLPVEQEQASQG